MVLFQGGAIIQKKIKEDMLFPGLKSETKEKLLQWGRMKSYGKKEIIFLDRQNEEKIYILLEGYAALYKVNKNMERKIIFILGPGD
ncbi:MAG: cyclic nucleotide-binding domain-containing protein, partial [Acetivibrio ethanolgignens]